MGVQSGKHVECRRFGDRLMMILLVALFHQTPGDRALEEWMVQQFTGCRTILDIDTHAFEHNIPELRPVQFLRPDNVHFPRRQLVEQTVAAFVPERELPSDHFEDHRTKTPDIGRRCVHIPHNDFRRHVRGSTNSRLSGVVRNL